MLMTHIKRAVSFIGASCTLFVLNILHVYAAAITAPSGTGLPEGSISLTLTKVVKFFLGIIGALAVLMVIVGGVMYIVSGGDNGKTETAKNIITYAIIGIAVALLAYVIVNTVITNI